MKKRHVRIIALVTVIAFFATSIVTIGIGMFWGD